IQEGIESGRSLGLPLSTDHFPIVATRDPLIDPLTLSEQTSPYIIADPYAASSASPIPHGLAHMFARGQTHQLLQDLAMKIPNAHPLMVIAWETALGSNQEKLRLGKSF